MSEADYTQEQLFVSLGEQLSHTFLLMSRTIEQAALNSSDVDARQTALGRVHDLAEAAAMLTDAYVLSVRLQQRIVLPSIQPVTVSSLLYDAIQDLIPLAAHYNVTLELEDLSRMNLVMGDAAILRSALITLGQVFVLAAAESDKPLPVVFTAHRGRYGVVAGIYTKDSELSIDAFRRAKTLYGKASQPLARLASGPATGVFVADALLHTLPAKLHVARYHHLTGLATTLPLCNQLQLV